MVRKKKMNVTAVTLKALGAEYVRNQQMADAYDELRKTSKPVIRQPT